MFHFSAASQKGIVLQVIASWSLWGMQEWVTLKRDQVWIGENFQMFGCLKCISMIWIFKACNFPGLFPGGIFCVSGSSCISCSFECTDDRSSQQSICTGQEVTLFPFRWEPHQLLLPFSHQGWITTMQHLKTNKKFHLVWSMASCFASDVSLREHIPLKLYDLYWLWVCFHVQFKVLILIMETLMVQGCYLRDLSQHLKITTSDFGCPSWGTLKEPDFHRVGS